MMSFIPARALGAVLLGLALMGPAAASTKDYEFELVQSEVKQGEAVVAVRLVDKRSGKPVPDAVIFAKRIDMAPNGMPTMDSPIEQVPSIEPGIYRFKTNLPMAGGWQLSLGAKVQGETGTVENKLVLKAVK
jgi:YtkA-like